MEKQYQNEGFHQYMTIHLPNIDPDGYEIPMLLQFHGTSLLPVIVNGRNGDIQLRYDISGTAALCQIVEGRELNSEFLRRIIASVWKCCDEVEEYLLSVDAIVLDPQMIYYHPGREQIYYCYLPDRQGNFQNDFIQLIEFCMKSTDHKDEDAVIFMYGLYHHVQENSFGREEIETYIQNISSRNEEVHNVGVHNMELYTMDSQINPAEKEAAPQSSPIFRRYQQMVYVYIVMGVLCIAVAVFLGFYYVLYKQHEYYLKIMICFAIASIICLYSALHTRRRYLSSSDDFMKSSGGQPPKSRENTVVSVTEDPTYESLWNETSVLKEAAVGCSTQYMDGTVGLWKLISMSADTPDILLYKLPGIFGRQQNVDYMISDPGVSRRHAMVFVSGTELYIEDLGSTNGTYIDNVRIHSGEPARIEENSILRIGANPYQVMKHTAAGV